MIDIVMYAPYIPAELRSSLYNINILRVNFIIK